jgi:CheY-like chemotaxis protein
VEQILNAGLRATSLTRQLLAFSRRQILTPVVLNLNEIVTGTEKLLRRLIGEDIELITVLSPALGCVRIDPGQIEQVIVNLAVNARDAMPHGGRLTIRTANLEGAEADQTGILFLPAGSCVLLEVCDTGCGMNAEVLSHIFEPFFTTKEQGKGTGLGLSTVYGIVTQSGGIIRVSSEPGQGAEFSICLPSVAENAAALSLRDKSRNPPGGKETVLFVEDDPLVRQLGLRILRRHGYDVLEAASGPEALATAKEHAEKTIHLLVTDVIMPKIGGPELATRLSAMRSHLKVLFISGYTDNALAHHGLLEPGIMFLQKPFTAEALLHKVREVLDSPGGGA